MMSNLAIHLNGILFLQIQQIVLATQIQQMTTIQTPATLILIQEMLFIFIREIQKGLFILPTSSMNLANLLGIWMQIN